MIDHDPLDIILSDWADSAESFANCFEIQDKNTRVVEFQVSPPQRQALGLLSSVQKGIILKGRQMWITTILLVWQLRLCWLRPGSLCAVVMHTDANAIQMSAICLRLYNGNPILVEQMPTSGESGHRIGFANGSQIVFTTANSEFLRSQAVNFAHLTEARDYDDLAALLASLKVASEGQIFIESTAGGEDDYHTIWTDSDPVKPDKGDYERLFLCWRDHPEYQSDVPFQGRLQQDEVDYIRQHNLTQKEANWWVKERRGMALHKRILMVQEHPSSPGEAFLTSGDKYLKRQVPVPDQTAPEPNEDGITRLHPYDPTHQYVAGMDPAPGSKDTGDPTGLVIVDITAWCVALTQEIRKPTREHEPATRALLAEYGDPVTNVETNIEGVGLCDYLRGAGVPMYHMVAYTGLSPEMLPKHGFRTDPTSRQFLFGEIWNAASGHKPVEILCRRLVGQLNALCYNKKGKPAAPKKGHEDLAIGLGLAMLAIPQALPARQLPRPKGSLPSSLDALMEMLDGGAKPNAADNFDTAIALEPQPGDFF